MLKLYPPLIFLTFLSLLSFAQGGAATQQLIQSAESKLNQNPGEALTMAMQAISSSKKADEQKNLAEALSVAGVANYKMDEYDKAKIFIDSAFTISEELRDTSLLSFCTYWLATLELNNGQYVNALDQYEKGYALAFSVDDKRNIARCLDGKASIYESLNENDKAEEFYRQSLSVARQAGFDEWYGGVVYSLANLLYKRGRVDSAISKYNEAIILSRKTSNLNNMANCYQQLASISYYDKKDSKRAMEYVREALDIFHQTGSVSSYSYSRLLMSTILIDDKQYDIAIDLAGASLAEGRDKDDLLLKRNAAEVLYYAYLRKGNSAKALEYHVLFYNLSEDVRKRDLGKELTRVELIANLEKEGQLNKAREEKLAAEMNARLERQKLVQRASFAVIILISIIAMLAILAFMEKRRDNRIIAAEKKKSDELLLNILPSEVADELKEYGHAKARNYDMATVLFADIKNFTQAAETMGPEKLVSEIDFYFRKFDEIIVRHKIEKIKTIGDAYLCVGGLPVADSDNAFYVLSAAIEMQQFMVDTKRVREKNGEMFFEVRIGIHTGPLVAGIVGMRKFAYDIWGDTVNVAARMEQNGQEGKINISGSTYNLVKDKFSCNYRGKIDAKNKGQIDMYFFTSKIG